MVHLDTIKKSIRFHFSFRVDLVCVPLVCHVISLNCKLFYVLL